MSQTKNFHVSLDIEGALKRNESTLDGVLTIDGRELSGDEVKAFLIDQRRQHGYKYYAGCDNMTPEGRCAGHDNE